MDKEYLKVQNSVIEKLFTILNNNYEPAQTSDILKECIKLLKPFAAKQEEAPHA